MPESNAIITNSSSSLASGLSNQFALQMERSRSTTPSSLPKEGNCASIHDTNARIGLKACTPQRHISIGQLASLLQEKENPCIPSEASVSSSSTKITWNSVISGLGSTSSLLVFPDDMSRSTSAPPAELLHHPHHLSSLESNSRLDKNPSIGREKPKTSVIGGPTMGHSNSGGGGYFQGIQPQTPSHHRHQGKNQQELTSHPNYAAYYYSQSRLNPRLPPPVYTPGQSWHHLQWGSGSVGHSSLWSYHSMDRKNSFSKSSIPSTDKGNDSSSMETVITPQDDSTQPIQDEGSNLLADASSSLVDDEAEQIQATLRHLSLDCSADLAADEENFSYFSDSTSNLFNSFRRPNFNHHHQLPQNHYPNFEDGYNDEALVSMNEYRLNHHSLLKNQVRQPYYHQLSGGVLKKEDDFRLPIAPSSALTPIVSMPVTSTLLEEFRASKGTKRFLVKEILPCVVEFSGDQFGSRFIQQKLETCMLEEKELIFQELLPHAVSLMTDVFGNYVIQKFFELGSDGQRRTLAIAMQGHVVNLSLQMYGCRVVQKALENLPADVQSLLIVELTGHVIRCVKDQNGNHVIQKVIERVPAAKVQFVVDSFKGQVEVLSMHPYGCRVLQRIFEHCEPSQSGPLLQELHEHVDELVLDQYGNYVIQHVIERGRPSDRIAIIDCVRGKLLDLSRHKFASNVVEKSMAHSPPADRRLMVEEILHAGPGLLSMMMKDPFANYVIQRTLDVADVDQREQLVLKIRPHLPTLKKYTYGKHIIAKVERITAAGLQL